MGVVHTHNTAPTQLRVIDESPTIVIPLIAPITDTPPTTSIDAYLHRYLYKYCPCPSWYCYR